MIARDPLALLETALAAAKGAGELMISPRPDVLDESARLLDWAHRQLEACRVLPEERSSTQVLETAEHLRRTIRRTAKLLQCAFDYHLRWALVKGSLAGGYDRGGHAADFISPGTLSVRG